MKTDSNQEWQVDAEGRNLVVKRFYKVDTDRQIIFTLSFKDPKLVSMRYPDAIGYHEVAGSSPRRFPPGVNDFYTGNYLKKLIYFCKHLYHISNGELIRLILKTKDEERREDLHRYSRQLVESPIQGDMTKQELNDLLHEGQLKTYSDDIGRFIDSIDDRPESW